MPVTVFFRDVGAGNSAAVRDLWPGKDLGSFEKHFTAVVSKHGLALIRVK